MITGMSRRQARFPEIGRIRKGAPKEPNKPGKDLTYFRIDFDQTDPFYERSLGMFEEKYGKTPQWLDVMLPFPHVDESFDAYREAYLASGMVFRGSFWPNEHGEYQVIYELDRETGVRLVIEGHPYKTYDPSNPVGTYGGGKPLIAKPVGRLRVVLPVLKRLAFLTALTGSVHDINLLSEQLLGLQLFQGGLTAIPLIFRRKPVKISVPKEDGSRVKMTKWLLSIEAHPQWVEQKLIAAQMATLPQLTTGDGEMMLMLDAPIVPEEEEDPTVVEEEEFDSPADKFWHYVYKKANMSREEGSQVLAQFTNQGTGEKFYAEATAAVERQIPPDGDDDVPF